MIFIKRCRLCNKEFEANLENFYKNNKNTDGLHSYCKSCNKEKSLAYREKNLDERIEYDRAKYIRKKDIYKDNAREWSLLNKDKKKINYKNWQNKNRDKIKEYQEKRKMHKDHDISNEELKLLYDYCNSSCMYCGTSESEAIELYGQKLHKDHAINNGSDRIDNCILACKSCNSSKHDRDWDEWYKNMTFYDIDKYNKILNWLDMWK